MKDFIFIIGPSAVGKTTLAKKLYKHYESVYIEQNMVPEFCIPNHKDIGQFEEDICWENTLMQLDFFYKKGFRHIVALDFDDIRTREIPKLFKNFNFITLKLVSSSSEQIKNQMINRHENEGGLFFIDNVTRSNEVILKRTLLPNEVMIDIYEKDETQIFHEAIKLIDSTKCQTDYEYTLPDREEFLSWVWSNNLR